MSFTVFFLLYPRKAARTSKLNPVKRVFVFPVHESGKSFSFHCEFHLLRETFMQGLSNVLATIGIIQNEN